MVYSNTYRVKIFSQNTHKQFCIFIVEFTFSSKYWSKNIAQIYINVFTKGFPKITKSITIKYEIV